MDREQTLYVVVNDPAFSAVLEDLLQGVGFPVHSFSTGEQFLATSELADIGCVITDLHSPSLQGITIQKELAWRGSTLSLIGISEKIQFDPVADMMKHGAIAVLKSPPNFDELLAAVKKGLEKSHARNAARHQSIQLRTRLCLLTDAERQVMKCLIRGLSHKTVSHLLDLSPRTVDRRRKSILEKSGVSTLQELVVSLAELHFPD